MTTSISSFTGGEVAGNGIFDEMMRSVKAHVVQEFKANRLNTQTYAEVYLGMLQSVVGASQQFTLQVDITNQQALLLQQQVLQAEKQNLLLTSQIAKAEADTALSVKQLDILNAQELQVKEQTKLVTQNIAVAVKSIEQSTSSINLIDQQVQQAVQQTALATQQVINTTNENTSITKAQLKTDAETAFTLQRTDTEKAQILDIVNGIAVAGAVGKQNVLYTRQADGFTRDAEQKAAKIYADFYSITQSALGNIVPTDYGANGAEVIKVLDVLKAGINID